jgi:hypothetical protein
VEQQVGKYASISVTYLNARGNHQYLSRSLPITTNGVTTISNTNQSEGVFRQNQININTNIRTPKGFTIFGYYSANWANANDSRISDPFDPSVDYGRASFGTRSRLFLGGNIPLPYHISASPMLQAQSGSPYNITMGTPDSITLGGNDRPAFNTANGITAANANCLVKGDFASSNYFAGDATNNQVPVNFCTGPASVSFNLRLGRTFGFGPKTAAALAAAAAQAAQGGPNGPPPGERGGGGGGRGGGGGGRGGGPGGGPGGGGPGGGGPGGPGGGSSTGRKYNLTIGAQAQNLFNEVPYANPNGNWNSPQFGKTTSITSGNNVRRISLQANFNF